MVQTERAMSHRHAVQRLLMKDIIEAKSFHILKIAPQCVRFLQPCWCNVLVRAVISNMIPMSAMMPTNVILSAMLFPPTSLLKSKLADLPFLYFIGVGSD